MKKVFSLSRGVNPVMGVRVDWNSEEKKGLLLVKGGDEGTNFFSYVGKVLQEDAYQQAMDEFKNALKMRGNWTVDGGASPVGPDVGPAQETFEEGTASAGLEEGAAPAGSEGGAATTELEGGAAPARIEGGAAPAGS